MAIYGPPSPVADPPPVVVLIAGYPDAGFEKHLGCKFMEMEWAISMAQLIAMLIVRSGLDETPGLNEALDGLLARAIAANRPISLANYPDAPHSFDFHLDRRRRGEPCSRVSSFCGRI